MVKFWGPEKSADSYTPTSTHVCFRGCLRSKSRHFTRSPSATSPGWIRGSDAFGNRPGPLLGLSEPCRARFHFVAWLCFGLQVSRKLPTSEAADV